MRKVTLNDLPKYSKWPERLLGLLPWEQRVKSREEIDREYEHEQWGAYLKKIEEHGFGTQITTEMLDAWQCPADTALIYSLGEELFEDTAGNAYKAYLQLISETLSNYLPASSLLELASGYGSVLLHTATQSAFEGTKLYAAEYTPSGKKLTEICAQNQGISLSQLAHCDFLAEEVCDLQPEPGGLVFTCISACTLPKLPQSLIHSLCRLKPKAVLHFEPCYEHHQGASLLDKMRKRYVEVNDYNTNLLTLLKEQQDKGIIQILEEQPAIIGVNPLFPISLLVWRPI